VQVFDEEHALDKFEAFTSLNGAAFYGLPVNEQKVTLVKKPQQVPDSIGQDALTVCPYKNGETLDWSIKVET